MMWSQRWRGAFLVVVMAVGRPAEGVPGNGPRFGMRPAGAQEQGRDPFRAAVGTAAAARPPGLRGVQVMEAVVRGVVHARLAETAGDGEGASEWAILESPSGEGFVASPGDPLLDGVVGRVEADAVVFWLGGDPERPVHRPLTLPTAASGGER